jgi:hypothetical protein
VVTDRGAGVVRVLLNAPSNPFASAYVYRTDAGPLAVSDGTLISRAGLAVVVPGRFDGDARPDLVAVHSNRNGFTFLRSSGAGGFDNPTDDPVRTTGPVPIAAVAGRFDADAPLGLAVLDVQGGGVTLFRGDGQGGFVARGRLEAGTTPTGLTAGDVDRDGRLDLLVGNAQGDVLTFLGNGDGTFQPFQRAGRRVALAVADLNGDGRNDFVFGNEARDRVFVQYSRPGPVFEQDHTDGVLAPGAVAAADLDRDGRLDLVVANGGGNSVLVYLGRADGSFTAARPFFVGTNPIGLTISDLNGDGWLDLAVANAGSNDVSVLLGAAGGSAPGWSFVAGPRLMAGLAPVSVTAADVTADGTADLVVGSGSARYVSVLPGLGGGFFDDRAPLRLQNDGPAGQVLVGAFDRRPGLDVVTINPGAGTVTLFSGLGPGRSFAAGGPDPIAAVAGDFNRDGVEDLVVASHTSGQVALLTGGDVGFRLFASLTSPDLPHPTALALGGVRADGIEVYAVGEGGETAVGLTFVLDLSPVLPPADTSGGGAPATVFQPLPGSAVGLVATLLLGEPAVEAVADTEPPATPGEGTAEGGGSSASAVLVVATASDEAPATEENAAPEELPADDGALNRFLLDVSPPRLTPSQLKQGPAASETELPPEAPGPRPSEERFDDAPIDGPALPPAAGPAAETEAATDQDGEPGDRRAGPSWAIDELMAASLAGAFLLRATHGAGRGPGTRARRNGTRATGRGPE